MWKLFSKGYKNQRLNKNSKSFCSPPLSWWFSNPVGYKNQRLNKNSKSGIKGQVSLDAVIAILFLLIVFSLIGYNVLNTANSFKESEKAERAHATIDVFENYVLTSYSKEVAINTTFKPMGNLNYTIYFSDKKIEVKNETNVIFTPEYDENGIYIHITGKAPSGLNLPQNIVNISFGEFYVYKNLTVRIK